jgi:hypothetical protein
MSQRGTMARVWEMWEYSGKAPHVAGTVVQDLLSQKKMRHGNKKYMKKELSNAPEPICERAVGEVSPASC